MVRIFDILLLLGEAESALPARIAELLDVPAAEIAAVRVVRRSLDARRERPPRFVYIVDVSLPDEKGVAQKAKEKSGGKLKIKLLEDALTDRSLSGLPAGLGTTGMPEKPVVVVGSGPAGLFSALALASRGVPVIVLERGKPVGDRVADTVSFWQRGVLNRESNVHFGEGGAGTFSDGKLTTRLKDARLDWIKKTLVELGAPEEILVSGKPHIGTDRLRDVVVNLRKRLIGLGCEVRFGARVTDFVTAGGRVRGVIINDREEIGTDHLVLAIGQSAVDTYERLHGLGVRLEAKPFAMGLRVEHPQELINRIQYGRWWPHPELPPAEYFLTAGISALDRSVYTFCMCPGGRIIGCSSGEDEVVTNGMSLYSRGSPHANSAVVVNVRTSDFSGESPLSGLNFRRRWEEKAFLLGGGDYRAPAQRLTDFVAGKGSRDVPPNSFCPGVRTALLEEALPAFAGEALRRGVLMFNEKMPGFLTAEACLIGVETRTSSPVRILRGADGQSITVSGLYPCGEGAGYAGGIMSSALDGIRAAENILRNFQ